MELLILQSEDFLKILPNYVQSGNTWTDVGRGRGGHRPDINTWRSTFFFAWRRLKGGKGSVTRGGTNKMHNNCELFTSHTVSLWLSTRTQAISRWKQDSGCNKHFIWRYWYRMAGNSQYRCKQWVLIKLHWFRPRKKICKQTRAISLRKWNVSSRTT
jgi:hypothetical protein